MASIPKLRNLELHLVTQSGQQGVLVQDPLRLANRSVFLPMALVPLLALCDGTRDEGALRASLAVRAGVQIGPSTLEQVLSQLEEALLLDNDRFTQAYASALREFRTATMRAPALAGRGFRSRLLDIRRIRLLRCSLVTDSISFSKSPRSNLPALSDVPPKKWIRR